jgi:uncharacterized DUF497 family protein
MKVAAIGMLGLLILAVGLSAQKTPDSSVQGREIFTGVITDSLCAEGHHIDAIKYEKNCVLTCVKFEDAQFVLYNAETKRDYKLDDQQQPKAFAGQEVIVIGSYDKASNAIRVIQVRPKISYGGL